MGASGKIEFMGASGKIEFMGASGKIEFMGIYTTFSKSGIESKYNFNFLRSVVVPLLLTSYLDNFNIDIISGLVGICFFSIIHALSFSNSSAVYSGFFSASIISSAVSYFFSASNTFFNAFSFSFIGSNFSYLLPRYIDTVYRYHFKKSNIKINFYNLLPRYIEIDRLCRNLDISNAVSISINL